MRGDQVYRVYGLHEGREKDTYFGTFRSIPEAEAKIASLLADERDGRNWAQTYHNRGFVIRPANRRDRLRDSMFIRVSRWGGISRVTFAVAMQFDLETGRPDEWQRLRIADFE
jgi:hypothetical protein